MRLLVTLLVFCVSATAFQSRAFRSRSTTFLRDVVQVQEYLKERYPMFDSLIMSKNADVWKKLSDASNGFTIFAPSDAVFAKLGDKRVGQLQDARNSETAEKMAAFHAVGERVTAEELFASGGVITLAGVVDVGRSTTGGFMGIGGKEAGGVTVNGAKVATSVEIGKCILHDVDALISPEILWRYCDQLRIPGSK